MGILKKGKDFTPTEQVTSTKLDELVDNASFTDSNEDKVAYTGTSGTCLNGGGLEVTGLGQLQIANSGVGTNELTDTSVTTAKINDSAVTTGKINDSAVTTAKIADDAVTGAKIEPNVGLTGAPTAPTPSSSSNGTRIATTAYVTSGINNALTGAGGLFGTIDQTANSTTRIFSKQSDGDYDSVTPSGDVTMTQAGVFSLASSSVDYGNLSSTAISSLKSVMYPIGYILTTTANYTNSSEVVAAFGGTTWVRYGEGRVLVGYDSTDSDFNTVNDTGGSKTHTLDETEIPGHTHNTGVVGHSEANFIEAQRITVDSHRGFDDDGNFGTASSKTTSTGGGGAHNNLQPYVVVYMWRRTA